MATGLMAMAKTLEGETAVDTSRVSDLVGIASDAMQARGKAELGGKTVFDNLDAVASATACIQGMHEVPSAASTVVDDALDNFRNTQATIGRARMFGEKTIGIVDPGVSTTLACSLYKRLSKH